VKRLIVTGDDFGVSTAVNRGILRAHRDGILRGTSLMVAGGAVDDAAEIAREYRQLDVGLHLVVCQGRSVMAADRLDGLVDSARNFADQPAAAGMRYFFDRRVRSALQAECEAQVVRHLELVGYLNHIDGHLNFHVHPIIANIVIDLAIRYHVPYLRLPLEPVITTLRLARDNAPRKLVEAVIFHLLARRVRRQMSAHGIGSTDELYGLHQSGNQSEGYVLGVIDRLHDGLTEFYFHPTTGASFDDEREVNLLTSGIVRNALERAEVELTSFGALAREASNSR